MTCLLFFILITLCIRTDTENDFKYLKLELMDFSCKEKGVQNYFPLFNDGDQTFSICTNYVNEWFLDFDLKLVYSGVKTSNVTIELHKLGQNCSEKSYLTSEQFKIGKCGRFSLDNYNRYLFSVQSYISLDLFNLLRPKKYLRRTIFSSTNRSCQNEYERNILVASGEVINFLGYSIQCNDTHVASIRKIEIPFSSHPPLVKSKTGSTLPNFFIGRIEKIKMKDEQRCQYGGLCFRNFINPYEPLFSDYKSECTMISEDLNYIDSAKRNDENTCPLFELEFYWNKQCTGPNLLNLFSENGACFGVSCQVDTLSSGLSLVDAPQCSTSSTYGVGTSGFYEFFDDSKCSKNERNFVLMSPNINDCYQYSVEPVFFTTSVHVSCADDDKYLAPQNTPFLTYHETCDLDDSEFNKFLIDTLSKKKLSPDPTVYSVGSGACSPDDIDVFPPAQWARFTNLQNGSFSLNCDDSNLPYILEFDGSSCKPPSYREYHAKEMGRRFLCFDSQKPVVVGDAQLLSKVLIFCSPPICYGKTEYDEDVCSGNGICGSNNDCSCHSFYSGDECSVSGLTILGICVGIVGCCCLFFICCNILCFAFFCVLTAGGVWMIKIGADRKLESFQKESAEKGELLPLFSSMGSKKTEETEETNIQHEGDTNDGVGRIFKNGQLIFEGQFRNGKKEGKGKEFFFVPTPPKEKKRKSALPWKRKREKAEIEQERGLNVIKFEGLFSNDKRHGRGIEYIFEDDGGSLEGIWKNGVIVSIERDFVDLQKIDISEIKFDFSKDLIASGGEGDVFRVKFKNQDAALKIFRKVEPSQYFDDGQDFTTIRRHQMLIRSQKIWSRVSHHPYICDLLAWSGLENEPKGYLTELCRTSLSSVIARNDKLKDWSERIRILFEIAVGMKFLHSMSIMHRDLKVSNVLLDFQNTVKICDFEFSRYDEMDWRRSVANVSVLGTPISLAPEIMRASNTPYSKACDVYSFGIVVYCVYFGVLNPYMGTVTCSGCGDELKSSRFMIHQHVANCDLRPEIDQANVVEEYEWVIDEVLKPCIFSKFPSERPTFEKIVSIFKKRSVKIEDSEVEEEEENKGELEKERTSIN